MIEYKELANTAEQSCMRLLSLQECLCWRQQASLSLDRHACDRLNKQQRACSFDMLHCSCHLPSSMQQVLLQSTCLCAFSRVTYLALDSLALAAGAGREAQAQLWCGRARQLPSWKPQQLLHLRRQQGAAALWHVPVSHAQRLPAPHPELWAAFWHSLDHGSPLLADIPVTLGIGCGVLTNQGESLATVMAALVPASACSALEQWQVQAGQSALRAQRP